MRLAIVSDIHGNLIALEAVLKDLAMRSVDATINLGDCVTSPLWPRETLELLNTLDWPTVRGNHDRWLVDSSDAPPSDRTIDFTRAALTEAQRNVLHSLPDSVLFDGDVRGVHGTPDSDRTYLLEDAVDDRLTAVDSRTLRTRLGACKEKLILCGHSHHARVVAVPNGPLIINPGSVGCPRSADHPRWQKVEVAGPMARYAIATRANAQWSVELISIAYDYTRVVERASENGRSDWTEGFLSGVG